ncbi:GNAT family N-acetyltransferase [Actinoplanes sp. NPDC051633]|uniref:GNAT family N-acetyltransferase n=1 Tax=Actinoplanes sp. NPDC051633 TaxID=3155670 RepID=UPI00343834D9
MRHAGDGPWWSGAVIPHGTPGSVAAAERFYAAHGAVTRFQICEDCPPGLDDLLAGRGYRRESPVLLMTARAVAPLAPAPAVEVTGSDFSVRLDGVVAGRGRAVAENGWTGVFDMVTAPAARRRGVARQILAAIAEWAAAHGAPRLYLQVEESNDAARRLYESAGFSPLTTYHYRVSAPASSA